MFMMKKTTACVVYLAVCFLCKVGLQVHLPNQSEGLRSVDLGGVRVDLTELWNFGGFQGSKSC